MEVSDVGSVDPQSSGIMGSGGGGGSVNGSINTAADEEVKV